jgi:hypothetical protein
MDAKSSSGRWCRGDIYGMVFVIEVTLEKNS